MRRPDHPTASLRRSWAASWSRRRLRRGEDGELLFEVGIVMLVTTILLTMTIVMMSTVYTQTTATVTNGASTDAASASLSTLGLYLRGAASPLSVASAAGYCDAYNGGTACPAGETQINWSTEGACWAGQNVSSTAQPTGTNTSAGFASTTENNTNYWPTPPTVEQNAGYGVIVAHDFDIEFCGYAPNSTSATDVYEIYMGNCKNATYGYCTVYVVSYGSTYNPTTDFQNPAPSGAGTVIYSIPDVWCDATCQSALATGSPSSTSTEGSAPSGAQYGSNAAACVTYYNYNQSVVSGGGSTSLEFTGSPPNSACSLTGVANAPSVSVTPNSSFYTPPLFSYYVGGSTSPTPTITGGTVNGSNTYFLTDVSEAPGATNLSNISAIQVQMTILSSKNTNTPAPQGRPGTPLSLLIYTPGLSGHGQVG